MPRRGVIQLTRDDITRGGLPASSPPTFRRTDEGLEVVGDPTGGKELYVGLVGDGALVAESSGELLDVMRAGGGAPAISAASLSHVLHHSFVPVPQTVYEDVAFLAIGDSVQLTVAGRGVEMNPHHDMPWLRHRSAQDQAPDTQRLRKLLARSVERKIDAISGGGFLMLSSGKDSVAVALAVADVGRDDIPGVTFRSSAEDDTPDIAGEMCRRLGLRHVIVDHRGASSAHRNMLVDFFTHAPFPSGDLALIPYIWCVAEMQPRGGFVLDGDGGDIYMGFLPSPKDRLKHRLRVRNDLVRRLLTRFVPIDSPLNYALRSRLETLFSLRTLRYRDTSRFYPQAVDTHRYWWDRSRRLRDHDLIDLKAERARHHGAARSMLKMRLAVDWGGAEAVMPYCDRELAQYCFGLPEGDKFDLAHGTNKVLLRRMLEEAVGYDAAAVGKHPFLFDGARFLAENRTFVHDEITGCAWWNDRAGHVAAGWLDDLERRPFLYHPLLVLFQVSAWLNHSRYVR